MTHTGVKVVRREIRKVILADLPSFGSGVEFQKYAPNLGILYLISSLRAHAPRVSCEYLEVFHDLRSHLDAVAKSAPDLYGLSFSSVYAGLARETIKAVKTRFPDIPIVCGGAHCSAVPEEVLRTTLADVCCIGEGESTLVDLVDALSDGREIGTVKGICYRKGDQFIRTPPRELADLRNHPLPPAWDVVDFSKYPGLPKYRGQPSTILVPSRGCPFDCTFCSNPVWRAGRPLWRARDPAHIAEEVTLLYRQGIREIWLQADEMNCDRHWCIEVFDAIAGLNFPDCYLQCNLRASPVDDQIAAAMKRANCWLAHLGVESGTQRVLDGIRKGTTIQHVENACTVLKRHGIKVFAFCMLYQVWEQDGKLQVESPGEVDQTLSFLRRLRSRRLIDYCTWTFATPYPGARMWDVALRYNLTRLNKSVSEHDIPMMLPGISRIQMVFSRAKGLMFQGKLALTSEGFFRRGNYKDSLRKAFDKMRFILRPW